MLFGALALFFLQFNLLQLGAQIAKHLLWNYSLCIIQKTRLTGLCSWLKWLLLGFYFWLLNCHFCSTIPAIFFLWSFLWTYCHSLPFIPLNVLLYKVLQYTLSQTLWEYDVPAEKADIATHRNIPNFVWFETQWLPWSTSFWTSVGITVSINTRINCALCFIGHFFNGRFFN